MCNARVVFLKLHNTLLLHVNTMKARKVFFTISDFEIVLCTYFPIHCLLVLIFMITQLCIYSHCFRLVGSLVPVYLYTYLTVIVRTRVMKLDNLCQVFVFLSSFSTLFQTIYNVVLITGYHVSCIWTSYMYMHIHMCIECAYITPLVLHQLAWYSVLMQYVDMLVQSIGSNYVHTGSPAAVLMYV